MTASFVNTSDAEFVFRNVNISLNNNHIVRNVSGVVEKGEILGIFGPKGMCSETIFFLFFIIIRSK